VAVEDRDWFREGSLERRDLASSTTTTYRDPGPARDPRSLSSREVALAFLAAGIQAALFVADEIGWLDVPFV
jgi:hypothetical protein